MEFNLDSRLAVTAAGTAGAPIDFTDPTTYNNATSHDRLRRQGRQTWR